MKKLIFITFITLSPVLLNNNSSLAKDSAVAQHEFVKYDLSQNTKQTFTLISDSGEISYVTIEPIESSLRLKDATYKVTHEVPNSWIGSFHLKIVNNSIISVSNPAVSALTGSVYDYSLTKNSSTKATLNLKWRNNQGILMDTGFYAKVSDGALYTTRIY